MYTYSILPTSHINSWTLFLHDVIALKITFLQTNLVGLVKCNDVRSLRSIMKLKIVFEQYVILLNCKQFVVIMCALLLVF